MIASTLAGPSSAAGRGRGYRRRAPGGPVGLDLVDLDVKIPGASQHRWAITNLADSSRASSAVAGPTARTT